MDVFAIKSNDARLGYKLYTRQWVETHILSGRTWRMQLTDADTNEAKEDSHIYYEGGDPKVIMDEIELNGYWGAWVLTEQKQELGNILDAFFANEPPCQLIICMTKVMG